MKMLIARLAFLICILGCVAGLQKLDSTASSTNTVRSCQPSGGYCRLHVDCCSGMCIQVSAECR
ncbi:conotoxin ArMKLT2-0112 [Drosophila erecta]|uniref:conotoxin ArMKLT2-0112 n=1 Tax=Drosophila erecta TaxID=7220 RepID=UPI0007328EB0|nr:conotoxin ArMKLT2-0112 [Drosophila erecta]KQS39494.1 uncharacterized protein Dere_GG26489 [Drosophila erecta]